MCDARRFVSSAGISLRIRLRKTEIVAICLDRTQPVVLDFHVKQPIFFGSSWAGLEPSGNEARCAETATPRLKP